MDAEDAGYGHTSTGSVYWSSANYDNSGSLTLSSGASAGGSGEPGDGGKKKGTKGENKAQGPLRSRGVTVDPLDAAGINPVPKDTNKPHSGQEKENGGEKNTATGVAGKVVEATAQAVDGTKQMVIGAQKLANKVAGTSSEIFNGGEIVEGVSKKLVIVSAVITVADGVEHGFKPHHIADLGVDVGIYALSASVPVVGWAVGGAYFITNMIVEAKTGKSITENLLDK